MCGQNGVHSTPPEIRGNPVGPSEESSADWDRQVGRLLTSNRSPCADKASPQLGLKYGLGELSIHYNLPLQRLTTIRYLNFCLLGAIF